MYKALILVVFVTVLLSAQTQGPTFLNWNASAPAASCPPPAANANIQCSSSDKGMLVSNVGAPYVSTAGTQGPQGIPGIPGVPGPQGPGIADMKCPAGQYVTGFTSNLPVCAFVNSTSH